MAMLRGSGEGYEHIYEPKLWAMRGLWSRPGYPRRRANIRQKHDGVPGVPAPIDASLSAWSRQH